LLARLRVANSIAARSALCSPGLVHRRGDHPACVDPSKLKLESRRRAAMRLRAGARRQFNAVKVGFFPYRRNVGFRRISLDPHLRRKSNSGTGYELFEAIAMVVIGVSALTGGRCTIPAQLSASSSYAYCVTASVYRRAWPRLTSSSSPSMPWHDGAPLLARAPTPSGDLTDESRPHPHGARQQVLRRVQAL